MARGKPTGDMDGTVKVPIVVRSAAMADAEAIGEVRL
jgi:hypothetical protein